LCAVVELGARIYGPVPDKEIIGSVDSCRTLGVRTEPVRSDHRRAELIAGASGIAPGRFIPFAFIAAGLWSATCCLLGYIFWQSLDQVAAIAEQGTLALGVLLATAIVAMAIYHRRVATR
jgi:hypothetical protein